MHSIIQIGAGAGEHLPEWLEGDAQRIVLVEPNPTLAETLRQATSHDSRTQVVEAAVAHEPGTCELLEYNLPQASGLHEPTGLKPLFPGLKLLHRHKVTAVTPQQLMEQHGSAEKESLHLVIHAPGEEHNTVQALVASDQLQQVSRIFLTASSEPLSPGAVPIQQTLDALQNYGYHLQQHNDQDPDWPRWELHLDVQQQRIKTLIAEREALAKQHADLEQQSRATQKKLDQAGIERAEVQQQLEKAHKQQQDLETKLTERDQQLKDAQQQSNATQKKLDQAGTELADVKQQLKQANAQQQALQAKLTERDQQLKDAQQQSSATQKKLNQADTERAEVQQQLGKAHKQQQDLETKLAERDQQLKDAKQHSDDVQKKLDDTHGWFMSRKQQALEQAEALKVLEGERDELQCQLQKAHTQQQGLETKLTQRDHQLKSAQQNSEDIQKQLAEAVAKEQSDHQLTTSTLKEKKQQFQSQKQQVEKLEAELGELKKERERLQQKLECETDCIAQLQSELALVNDKLTEQQASSTKLDDLEKKIASLGSSLTSHLDKKLTNAAKQIEDTLGLQNYFCTGELPLSYHGWPISPDLALYLTESLETENYDLVIEFGSGTSTVLFAKVLMTKMLRQTTAQSQRQIEATGGHEGREFPGKEQQLPTNNDLPKRVLTFEHNEHYFKETGAMLRQAGLENVVNLVHAPLVDYNYQGDDYLYYDCDKTLTRLAEIYEGRQPKILVLVDGPPGATCPNARFPALPKILSVLTKAKLEIVMDDYFRNEEKAIIEKWKGVLEKRGIFYKESILNFEKGAFLLAIG